MTVSRRTLMRSLAACALMGCGEPSKGDAGVAASDDATCTEGEMPRWVAYAGRIMVADNSLGVGYHGLVGGFRAPMSTLLTARGIQHTWVGPYSDAYGAHRSVSGISAVQQSSALQTDCETYDPRIVILGYAENDLGGAGGGQSRTPAQAIDSMTSCIRWARAGAPQAIVLVRTVVVPQTNGIPGYYARRALFAEYNTLVPAMCAAEGAIMVDIGAPTTSDGLHFDDTPTGYPAAAAELVAASVAALPGGPLSA